MEVGESKCSKVAPDLTREKNLSNLFLRSSIPNLFVMSVNDPLNSCSWEKCSRQTGKHWADLALSPGWR